METFYLAGSADDPSYAQAELLGDLLLTRFPKVGFVKDVRHPCEWKEYRKLLTQKYGFNAPGNSVIIWRRDGRLIGSVGEFEKAVKAKYNLELKSDPAFVLKVMEENLELSEKATTEEKWTPYVGKFKKTWDDGMVFDGAWKSHQPHKGSVHFKPDLVYEGSLKNGLFHGQGVIRYPDGAKFAGIFREGKKEGLGRYADTAGNVFEGTYRHDQLNGKGSRKWPNGATYVGQWKHNKANGVGTETSPAAESGESGQVDTYTGQFQDDSRHGQGVMTYASGDYYDGQWVGGKRNGSGKFVWANVEHIDHFRGSFVEGLPSNGQIVFVGGLTAPFPGEISQQSAGENWTVELCSSATKWFESAKERKARKEAPYDTYPIQDADKNPMTQTLTEEKWDDLRMRLTTSGVGLHHCLRIDKHPVGLVAGDADCYTVFRELFDPVLVALHPKYETASHISDLDPSKLKTPAAVGEIIQTCTIRVYRCLAEIPFGVAIDTEERRKVEDLLVKALSSFEDPDLAGAYFPLAGSESIADKAGGMQAQEQSALEEDGFLFSKLECTDTREWPDARGVFCSTNKQTVAHINAQEHFFLTAICTGFGIPGLCFRVVKVLKGIEKALKEGGCSFAHSDRHGHLLCNLPLLGSGMAVEVAARFPRLARRRDIANIVESFGLSLKSEKRDMRLKTPGGTEVMKLEMLVPFGASEVEVFNTVIAGIEELVKLERALTAGKRQLWMFDEFPKVIVAGPPGSERKQLAKAIAQQCSLPLVSVGDILRTSISEDSPLATEAKKFLVEGAADPSQALIDTVNQRLAQDDCTSGWVLEGFPRTEQQAEGLKGIATPNKVVMLNAENAQLLLRALAQRKVDPETGLSYDPTTPAPTDDPVLTSRLVRRSCDAGQGAAKRIEQYRAAATVVQGMFPKAVKAFPVEPESNFEAIVKAASVFVLEAP